MPEAGKNQTVIDRFPVSKAEETFTALGELCAQAQPHRLIFAYRGQSPTEGEGISMIDYTYHGHIETVNIPISRVGQEVILGEEDIGRGKVVEGTGVPEVDLIEKFFAAVRRR